MSEKREIFYAYVCTDCTQETSFSKHFSHFAAEKKYGDLEKDYNGSSYSDYWLVISTEADFMKAINDKQLKVNWKEKTLKFL